MIERRQFPLNSAVLCHHSEQVARPDTRQGMSRSGGEHPFAHGQLYVGARIEAISWS